MATVRVVITSALIALRKIEAGDDPHVEELNVGLAGVQALVWEIHEARGPMTEIDVAADYVPDENQRVRIEPSDTVNITLPNSVPCYGQYDPYDYGFVPTMANVPVAGSTGVADGVSWRAPTDGARIEIVAASPALYFYRADLNQWMPALSLTLDTEMPFNDRLRAHYTALVADRLADDVGVDRPPQLIPRITRGRMAMHARFGAQRNRHVGEYF